ncbi:MAG: DUF362 domain-containing protein [Candidatus Methanomethylicia archaeon]|nr:DUF362 domain-containing protein [Candidatus Methanomethylicia archaeon]
MASQVYFFDFGNGSDVHGAIKELVGKAGGERIRRGMKVAVKSHFGEMGNYTHIRPSFVRSAVDAIKELGGRPFFTDTTTLYPEGGRLTVADSLETARYNGFTEEGLGCPVVIADAPDGESGVVIENDKNLHLKRVKVAKAIAEADAIIVLSHVKGHVMSGMGGAIKNLGMGCTTKGTKSAQHALHGCEFDLDKCAGCGKCVESCTFGALRMSDGKPARGEGCVYCLTCMFNCEERAIHLLEGGKERFQEGLAEAAFGVTRALAGKPVAYLNFVMDVTRLCDCAAPAGKLVVQNVGILASEDPVAIDKASLDLIDGSQIIPGWQVSPPDILGKLNKTSSLIHIRTAARLGMGSMEYTITGV